MYIIHILDEIAISINQPGFWARFLRHIRILFGEKSKLSRFPIFSVVTHSSPILQLPNLDPDPNVCNCWMSSSCFEYIFSGWVKRQNHDFPLCHSLISCSISPEDAALGDLWHTGLKAGLPRN